MPDERAFQAALRRGKRPDDERRAQIRCVHIWEMQNDSRPQSPLVRHCTHRFVGLSQYGKVPLHCVSDVHWTHSPVATRHA
jgi:hypothetical protein